MNSEPGSGEYTPAQHQPHYVATNRSRLSSFGDAIRGISYVLRTQPNAWIEMAATVVCVTLAILLGFSPIEWAVLAITIGGVFVAEMLNTAIETVVNLVSPKYHILAGLAKDVAAGAVLTTVITAIAVGLALYGPHLLRLLGIK